MTEEKKMNIINDDELEKVSGGEEGDIDPTPPHIKPYLEGDEYDPETDIPPRKPPRPKNEH